MAWWFGDGFDLYAAAADTRNNYWDNIAVTDGALVAGRFANSRALSLSWGFSNNQCLRKTSNVNDAVHHISFSFNNTGAFGGGNQCAYFALQDAGTSQCSILFLANGTIQFYSGFLTTLLATYSNAFTAGSTWYGFEFEIVINNITGRFRARRNGNPVDDFDSGAVLNTRAGTSNNYANGLQIGFNTNGPAQAIDDLLWRSDAASVPWVGDIRCVARMPVSDVSAQFSRTPTTLTQAGSGFSSNAITAGEARYVPFVSTYSGTVGSVVIQVSAGYTGNMKACIFASSGSVPTTPLGSTTVVANPITGANTVVFSTPATVVAGTTYFVSVVSDTTSGSWNGTGAVNNLMSTTPYASFPASSPTTSAAPTWGGPNNSVIVTENSNYRRINEPQQDTTTSYVSDNNPGDADFYGIAALTSTPSTTLAVTTRLYAQKTDVGTRTVAVQLKSGATTVASPTLVLSASGWQWASRTDLTDPATGAAWTAAAVNAATIGPTVIA